MPMKNRPSGAAQRKARAAKGLPPLPSDVRYDERKAAKGYGPTRFTSYKRTVSQRIKAERGCADCGFRGHYVALTFDHRPGTVKVLHVAAMCLSSEHTLEQVMEEIAKCDVVCMNCHMIRTHNRKAKKS